MSIEYSINEIVNFAVEIEKVGTIFYRNMSNKVQNESVKSLCIQLMKDEEEHVKTYKNILDSLPKNEELTYHLDNEYLAYLHAFVEKSVFDEEKVNKIHDALNKDIDIINYAIGKEEDSIEFYKNMKKVISKPENTQVIDTIIDEEYSHKDKLEKIKNKL